MKIPRPVKPAIGAALAVGGLLAGWLVFKNDDAKPAASAKPIGSAAAKPAKPSQETVAAANTDQPPTESTTPAAQKHAGWLRTRGRDAGSLIAVWDLSGDTELLQEAARNFPDDPRVCAAMIIYLSSQNEDALPWAERLIANEPENPAGLYWKAQLLAGAGKREEALAALEAATRIKGSPDTHLKERILTAREAGLASGGTPKQAATDALTSTLAGASFPLLNPRMFGALKKFLVAAKDAGDTETVTRVATLGVVAAEQIRLDPAPTLIDEMIGLGTLHTMIRELDPETEYGTGGKTAAEKLQEIEAERTEMQAFNKRMSQATNGGRDPHAHLTDGQMSEYLDRFILHGEKNAMTWLDSLQAAGQ